MYLKEFLAILFFQPGTRHLAPVFGREPLPWRLEIGGELICMLLLRSVSVPLSQQAESTDTLSAC